MLNLLVRNETQDVCNAVEARPFLVIRMNQMPRRMLAGSRFEHHVARPGIVIPAPVRLEIHRAQFPLPKRIVDACLEFG